jgi:ATP-binding cassette subfamily B protein
MFITASIKRIHNVLSVTPLYEPFIPTIPNTFGIEMAHIDFRYEEDGPDVLENINLSLPEGSFTALVGPSGSGKTTIVNLIARMWEVTDGVITI